MLLLFVFALPVFASETASKSKLEPVETKKVCMVNDKVFEKDQIPVEVDGKTYYGCCNMCKKALAEQADLRFAVDPVSGKKVDKAKAVIGADSEGMTYYFESVDNLKSYNEKK